MHERNMEKRALKFGKTSKTEIETSKNGPSVCAIIALQLITIMITSACATSGHLHTRAMLNGNAEAEKGNYIDAAAYYEKALHELPDSLAAKRNLGIVLVKIGDYERAIDLLKSASKYYSNDPEFLYFHGECFRGLKRYFEAADSYQKGLRINPSDLRITKALGWAWHKMNQNSWAVNLLVPFLRNNPGDHQLRLVLASALNSEQKYSKAIEILKFAESQNFELKSKDRITADAEKMLILNALANSYSGLGNCAKAQHFYNAVLKFRPFFDGALVGSAQCHLKSGSQETAQRLLERAVKANPTSWEAHYQLGQLLEQKESDRAKFYLNRFLEMTSGNEKIVFAERETARKILNKISARR